MSAPPSPARGLPSPAELFEHERHRLFGLAYRMLSSVADAEDVVQEAWLRFDRATRASVAGRDVERPEALLTTITTRLAIDRLRSAARTREAYVGPWLAEPILTDRDPAHLIELDESVRLGFLHVLERLSPLERAAFLLHEVFDVPYPELAVTLERSEASCRQLVHRARQHVRSRRPRFEPDPDHTEQLLDAFLAAAASGDAAQFERLLSDDVVLVSDGGPDHHAARRPVVGPDRVARFVVNLTKRMGAHATIERVQVNGDPAALVLLAGQPFLLVECEHVDGRVASVYLVRNPAKLAAVGAALSGSGPADGRQPGQR